LEIENVGSIPDKWKRFLCAFAKSQTMAIGIVMFVFPYAVGPSAKNKLVAAGEKFREI
jgi:hypothetical protein